MTDATLSTQWSAGSNKITVVLSIAGRTWTREFTERELVGEDYSGVFTGKQKP